MPANGRWPYADPQWYRGVRYLAAVIAGRPDVLATLDEHSPTNIHPDGKLAVQRPTLDPN